MDPLTHRSWLRTSSSLTMVERRLCSTCNPPFRPSRAQTKASGGVRRGQGERGALEERKGEARQRTGHASQGDALVGEDNKGGGGSYRVRQGTGRLV